MRLAFVHLLLSSAAVKWGMNFATLFICIGMVTRLIIAIAKGFLRSANLTNASTLHILALCESTRGMYVGVLCRSVKHCHALVLLSMIFNQRYTFYYVILAILVSYITAVIAPFLFHMKYFLLQTQCTMWNSCIYIGQSIRFILTSEILFKAYVAK